MALAALLSLAALWPAGPSLAATTVDRIVAHVDNDVITLSELNARLKTVSPLQRASLPPGANLELEVLNQIIEMRLINQAAQRMNIKVGEREVDLALESVKDKTKINDAQLKAILAAQSQTVADFREDLKFQILMEMVVHETIVRRTVAPDEEVDEYLSGAGVNLATLGEGATPLDKIRIIIIEARSGRQGEALSRAGEIYQQIASGSISFAEAARLHSQGLGADNGGDLGMTVGDLDEGLGALVRQLAPGQVGPPIDRGQDVLLIYVEPRAGAQAAPAAPRTASDYTPEQREMARRQLEQIKAKPRVDSWLEDLKTKANIRITL
jgi:peptidyl-prolyl cis-trans isomerase SurA